MARKLSRIKRRLYRVLYRDPQGFSEPADPRIDFESWFATFSELGYCEADGIISKLEPASNVLLDTGKNKHLGIKGSLSGKIVQSEIADFESFAVLENKEIDFLLYDENTGLAIFFPKALMQFQEEAKGGAVEKIVFEYKGENMPDKNSFRIRFNAQTGAGGIPLFSKELQTYADMYNGIGHRYRSTHQFMLPEVYYFKGQHERIYFAFSTAYDNPNTNTTTNYVGAIDLSDLSLLGPTDVGPNRDYYEYHHMPALIVTDDGFIIVVYDQLGASSGHNAGIRVMRSDNPEDIASFTQQTVLNGDGCYPYLLKKNNILYCGYRERDPNNQINQWIRWAKSTDGGQTWNTAHRIVNVGNDDNIWAYHTRAEGIEGEWMYLLLNPADKIDSPEVCTHLYVLKTKDGSVFYNMSGTFSKDTDADGYITRAELDANCLVYNVEKPDWLYFHGGFVTRTGELITMARKNIDGVNWWHLLYWDGKHWIWRRFDTKLNPGFDWWPMLIMPYDMNAVDLVIRNQSDMRLHRYRTKDRGLNWEYIGPFSDLSWGGDTPVYPRCAANLFDTNYQFLLLSIRPASGNVGRIYGYLLEGEE